MGSLRAGGTALLVVSEPETAASLVQFAEGISLADASPAGTKSATDFSLLGEIDFRHPIFASFSGPRYNDFTKVRFWKHQRFNIQESAQAQVLARFDDGDPAGGELLHAADLDRDRRRQGAEPGAACEAVTLVGSASGPALGTVLTSHVRARFSGPPVRDL